MINPRTFDLSNENVKKLGKEYKYIPPKILSKDEKDKYFVNLTLLDFDLKNGYVERGVKEKKEAQGDLPDSEGFRVLERVSRLI